MVGSAGPHFAKRTDPDWETSLWRNWEFKCTSRRFRQCLMTSDLQSDSRIASLLGKWRELKMRAGRAHQGDWLSLISGIEWRMRRPMRRQSPYDEYNEQNETRHHGPKCKLHQEQLAGGFAAAENATWHAARSTPSAAGHLMPIVRLHAGSMLNPGHTLSSKMQNTRPRTKW